MTNLINRNINQIKNRGSPNLPLFKKMFKYETLQKQKIKRDSTQSH